jgi:hypothetical protein
MTKRDAIQERMTLRNVATLAAVLALLAASGAIAAERDFDFAVGSFTTKVRRLQKPLTGSTAWIEGKGEVRTRKVLGGLGQLEEVELDTPSGHYQGIALRLYDPATRLWSFYLANARRGTLAGPPALGAFKDGRVELFDQEDYEGRTILVRHTVAPIEGGYHFEQAFSADGGKSWEPNWIADCLRAELPALPEARDRNRDFDASVGKWRAVVSHPSGGRWVDLAGSAEVTPIWGGRATLLELHAGVEGMGLRLYDPTARTWSLNWVNAKRMALEVPAVGSFSGGRGEFVAVEPIDGRIAFVRQTFAPLDKFEQAFSFDGGRTWAATLRIAFEPLPRDG